MTQITGNAIQSPEQGVGEVVVIAHFGGEGYNNRNVTTFKHQGRLD